MRCLFIFFVSILSLQFSYAQELTGTILKNGKPQKNVRVWLKHNKGVAKTDKEGMFWLPRVLPTDTLVMGVSTKYDAQLLIGEHKDIIVNLEEDGFTVSGGLEEVTVTAPSSKKTEYTSVITLKKMQVVNHDMIMRENIKSLYDIVRKIVPGAKIETDPLTFEKHLTIIRGRNSFRNPEPPLFIIDGIPYDAIGIEDILPVEDIAEVSVDRDGSGYGVRGANGVVIIRTLKGSDR